MEIFEVTRKKLEKIPEARIPSDRTILRWLKKNGFKSLKFTTKPGLNKAQKLRRVWFALEIINSPLERWKYVVWSDETSLSSVRFVAREESGGEPTKQTMIMLLSLERLYVLYVLGLLFLVSEWPLLLLAKGIQGNEGEVPKADRRV